MIRRLLQLIAAGCFLFGSTTSTIAADAPKDPAPKVTYQDHVLPILRNACLNCHNPDKKKGDLNLSSFTGAMAGSGGGKVIEPGDPDASKLVKVISWAEEPNMPPKGDKLPEKDIAVIKAWIAAGAPETSSSKVAAVKPKSNLAVVATVGKPDGPPPMPGPDAKLQLEPVTTAKRPATALVSLASSPWAPLIAVGGQKQILLYHADSLELIGILPYPEGLPRSLKFSRNGQLLIAGGGIGAKSGKVIAWNIITGQRVAEVGEEFDEVLAADISPDQSRVALGTPLRILKIYTTADAAQEHAVKKHTDWIQAVAYSPDGNYLASGDRAGGLWVWEGDTARELYNCAGHRDGVTDAAFRGDSKLLASASQDGTIKLWNMDDGKQAKNIAAHSGGVLSVAFTHDGKIVSSGRDGLVKVWSPAGDALKTLEKFDDIALRATFNHDGSRIFAGDYTGAIRVWTLADAKRVGELTPTPPSLSQRLAGIDQKIKDLQTAADKAAAEVSSAQTAATQAAAELKTATDAQAAASKAVETAQAKLASVTKEASAQTAKFAADGVPAKREERNRTRDVAAHAKTALATARSELEKLQQKLTAARSKPEETAPLAEAQKAVDAKTAEIKRLTDRQAKADADAKSAAEKYAAAKEAAAKPGAVAKTADADPAVAAAKQAVTKAKADVDTAQKALTAKTQANKSAADRLAKSQAAAKSATDAIAAAHAERTKLHQAAAARAPQASKQ